MSSPLFAFVKTLHRLLLLSTVVVCLATLTSCEPTANWHGEVEVAPGEWLRIEGFEGRAWFRCQWNGKEVYWGGDYYKGQAGYYDRQLPVCLRSWKGGLYLIFEERDFATTLTSFTYCKVGLDGTAFEEIKRQDFPRQIATQNIGVSQDGIKYDEDHKQVDNLKMIRALDVSSRYFHNTTTGWIWCHLETGRTREEWDPTMEEALAFYADFVKKYHPIALPTIERSTEGAAAEQAK